MNQKTVLTPMQLFFCAKLMDAVYYDYAYLAAMPDVQKEYALHEQETMEELEDQGMIERDFDDNVEMAEDLRELLTPVFLGEKEGRLDVDGKPSCRFHSKDGVITMTVLENGKITISGSSEGEIRALLKSGQDITVHGADVKVGQTARSFTAGELQDPAVLNAAVQLLKGEV